MCPAPDFTAALRETYKVSFDEDGAYVLTHVPFSSLKPGDLFTLEAPPAFGSPTDPLAGLFVPERLYQATSEPFMTEPVTGNWQIECEKL